MGLNTTVLVLNDALDQIAEDADFGKNLVAAILERDGTNHPIVVAVGNHRNPVQVIDSFHAGFVTLIAVGGNYATTLMHHYAPRCDHSEKEGQEELLREWAAKLGFTIRRKNERD